MIKIKKVQNIAISKLINNDKNPRTITEKNFDRLKRDIKVDPQFIANRPLLCYLKDDKYVVYAGNMRLRALQELGYTHAPIIDDSEEVLDAEGSLNTELMDRRTFIDNENYGAYDFEMLANEFDLEDLKGFDLPELSEMLPSMEAPTDKVEERFRAESQAETGDGMSAYSIVLVYEAQNYIKIFEKFQKIKDEKGYATNNEVVNFLFEQYEKSSS